MPIPLLKHHFCRRGSTGPKAHAHAAYISGTKLDDGHGNTADFTPKGGIIHAELWVPSGVPDWAKDRGHLWRRLEAREDKSTRPGNAILAHKFIGALPHELTLEENIRYVKDFIREQFTRKGYAADWAIHAPDPGSDKRNYHVHIMAPLRRFENGDWARTKDRFPKNSPALSQYIKEKQRAFFELQNRYLHKNGIKAHIQRQNGKWVVVQSAYSTYATTPSRYLFDKDIQQAPYSPYAQLNNLHQLQPGQVTDPINRPSRQSATTNPTQIPKDIRTDFRHAAHAVAAKRTGYIPPPMTGKPWPQGAIEDWAEWGHGNQRSFFGKYPELDPLAPVPTQGRNP